MSTMLLDSLRRRIHAMNTLWERAAADVSLEQMNHHERAGVLPMAFSFCHYLRSQDNAISATFLDEAPLWTQGNWAQRVGVTVDASGQGEPVDRMEQLRIGDLAAWRAFQSAVIARTHQALERLTEERLAEVVIPALPPDYASTYCALVVGIGNPLRKLETLECFVYQHGLRHLGEVEHARALVGLRGGLTA